MAGKQKCEILKKIRQRIADENNIPYQTRECTHQGECSGTCPYCESEVRYLETELKKRASLGKKVKVAAVCAGMALTLTGCSVVASVLPNQISGMLMPPTAEPEEWELSGEVAPVEPEEQIEDITPPEEKTKTGTAAQADPTPEIKVEIYEDLSGYVPSGY